MSVTTRAKFRVWSVKQDKNGDKVEQIQVILGAVTGDSGENAAFWKATPAGHLSMTITNPDAFETFKSGQEFYLDFTPAEGV